MSTGDVTGAELAELVTCVEDVDCPAQLHVSGCPKDV